MTRTKQELFEYLKKILAGQWQGKGFAQYSTIASTDYIEHLQFQPDDIKDSIHYNAKARYDGHPDRSGQTVFGDTGFIVLKENTICLVSAQISGRLETYELTSYADDLLTFDSIDIRNDPRMIKSQRILKLSEQILEYELNMKTHQSGRFENHLRARLLKTTS